MTTAPQPCILVMGATGTGKSTFINQFLPEGQRIKIGHDLDSMTKNLEEVNVQMGGQTVTLVDTPGFDDSDSTFKDFDIAQNIADWLANRYRTNGYKINGIIFMRDIRKPRATASDKANRIVFQKLVGAENYKNITLMTSFWPRPDDTEEMRLCVEREGKLKEHFWSDLKDSKMKRFSIHHARAAGRL